MTIDLVENLEMTQGGRGDHVLRIIMTQCVRKSICDSPLKYERSYINPRSINISSHETMLRREARSDCQNHNLHLESHFQRLAFFFFLLFCI